MKKLDIQVGDRITYIQTREVIENDGSIISPFYCYGLEYKELKSKKVEIVANNDRIFGEDEEILKIERVGNNGWYTVYEKEEEILDKKEKEYLNNLIKPFKNEVKYIAKKDFNDNSYFINITCYNIANSFCLPNFKKDKMYKNMKLKKKYTLKELGLE